MSLIDRYHEYVGVEETTLSRWNDSQNEKDDKLFMSCVEKRKEEREKEGGGNNRQCKRILNEKKMSTTLWQNKKTNNNKKKKKKNIYNFSHQDKGEF